MKKTLSLPKKKKWNKTKAKRQLDKLFSKKVRSFGYCQLKGMDTVHCSQVLQCAHIIGRANLRLRWEFLNALCVCSGHHVYYTYHPESWRELMETRFNFYKDLLAIRNEKVKFNEVFYKEKLTLLSDISR